MGENRCKRLSCLFSVFVLMLTMIAIRPQVNAEWQFDGLFSYQVNYDGETCTLMYYDGEAAGTELRDLVIPSKLGGYPVTGIANDAFYGLNIFKSIVIPEGIVSIGEQAFYANSKCTSITLPSTLRKISARAFMANSLLKEIRLPKALEYVGSRAFYSASGQLHVYVYSTTAYETDAFLNAQVTVIQNDDPTPKPTISVTPTPTKKVTITPTPSKKPTKAPTKTPTKAPTKAPTKTPTKAPTKAPTKVPTKTPTKSTTKAPTKTPTKKATPKPTQKVTFGDFVERLYKCALDRPSDASGKKYWIEEVESGRRTGGDCARFFLLEAPEFMNRNLSVDAFVETLYKTFFDRKSDADGKKGWVDAINSNKMTRAQVVENFIESTEWCNICAKYGVRSGAKYHKATEPSANAKAFATRLYTCCLGRKAEAAGLEYWALALTNLEKTGCDAAREFFTSAEFLNLKTSNEEYVKRLYKTFMGRTPAADEVSYWAGQIKSKAMTRNQVLAFFGSCDEFTAICAKYGIERGNI